MADEEGRDGDDGATASGEAASVEVDAFLDEVDFDADASVLTRRQAEVLVLRERGLKQATIADQLGTSRANVSSIEASVRENVAKARETVRFAELVSPPVTLELSPGTDLYDVPDMIFDACDDVDVKVDHSAPELMRIISESHEDAVDEQEVRTHLVVTVTDEGSVWVREA